nr:hypothetical protein [Tanacetum cinerariifolium]
MGEPLSPDRVFDFLVDEPEPHPAYDFFAPGLLPGYADKQMARPMIGKIVEPIVEIKEQMIAPVIDVEEDIAVLFEDDDFSDDDSIGRGPSTVVDEGQFFPLPAPRLLIPPSVIKDLSTRLGDLEYGHGQLVKKVIEVGGAEVAAGISIEEIGPRVFAVKGHVQRDEVIAGLTQHVKALQAAVQLRDTQTQ